MSGKPTAINGVIWADGHDVYVCLGACPVFVNLQSMSNPGNSIIWMRSMECILSNVMEGIAYYEAGDDDTVSEGLPEYEGIACHSGRHRCVWDEADGRWEYAETGADITRVFVNRKGDCIFPSAGTYDGMIKATPAGFRLGGELDHAGITSRVNYAGENHELHYFAVLSDIIQPCTTPEGNEVGQSL